MHWPVWPALVILELIPNWTKHAQILSRGFLSGNPF
jgi:hypothetical protein